MNKFLIVGSILAIFAILFGPVIVRQVAPPEERTFQRVHLADLEYTEVFFRNEAQDLDLAGMLFVPDGEGPFLAAVIIHGSGPSKRDHNWYLTLSSYMQKNGVAVLLPDKRGSEKSQEIVEVSKLGIIGLSQGGPQILYGPAGFELKHHRLHVPAHTGRHGIDDFGNHSQNHSDPVHCVCCCANPLQTR